MIAKKSKLYLLLSFFCFLSLLFFFTTKVKAYENITPIQVKELISSPSSQAIIIDVRTIEEFKTGHIMKSINIPLQILRDDINKYNLNKNTQIIVYCKSGVRSKKAAEFLEDLNFTNVYYLGGLKDWPYEIVND